MKWILWLNTIGEAAIAVGMFSMPGSFFPGAVGLPASIARAFSFAILTVAFISFSVSGQNTSRETLRNAVLILTVYHVLQLIAQFVNAALFPPLLIPPVVIHTIFSTLFIYYLMSLNRTAAPGVR
jgi:hypothetical protein